MALACCPPGSWPALKVDFKPLGEESTLGDLPIYVVGSGDKGIVVWPEVFGWEGRLKNICDQLASEGYFVVMPDHMRGAKVSDCKDDDAKTAFLKRWSDFDLIKPDIRDRIVPFLKEKGITVFGGLGFCWGAWVLFHASASGIPLKCGASCHPSVRLEGYQNRSEVTLANKVKCPMLFASAGNDPDNVKEEGDVSVVLQQKHPSSVIASFPDMQHGWVTRGDVSLPEVARDVKKALVLVQDFFRYHILHSPQPVP